MHLNQQSVTIRSWRIENDCCLRFHQPGSVLLARNECRAQRLMIGGFDADFTIQVVKREVVSRTRDQQCPVHEIQQFSQFISFFEPKYVHTLPALNENVFAVHLNGLVSSFLCSQKLVLQLLRAQHALLALSLRLLQTCPAHNNVANVVKQAFHSESNP